MKTIIHRVFAKKEEPREAAPSSAISSELTTSDIENYYFRIIADCLRRMLVPPDSIQIRVKRAGVGPSGLTAFAGYVRILRWDAVLTPVLLQNISVVDARIRKVVDASVILEHTHFAGLWFQATSGTQGAPQALGGILPAEFMPELSGST
jgi:hypothetical protein